MIRLRQIREIIPGKWREYMEIHAKVDARYAELGLPIPKRYRLMYGGGTVTTWISEREFDNLGAIDAASAERKAAGHGTDPELKELRRQYLPFVVSVRVELLEEL